MTALSRLSEEFRTEFSNNALRRVLAEQGKSPDEKVEWVREPTRCYVHPVPPGWKVEATENDDGTFTVTTPSTDDDVAIVKQLFGIEQ